MFNFLKMFLDPPSVAGQEHFLTTVLQNCLLYHCGPDYIMYEICFHKFISNVYMNEFYLIKNYN